MSNARRPRVQGRFAPSPTGELHLGNLRTALLAWLWARSAGGGFVVRMEDLDRVAAHDHHRSSQLADLHLLGIDWDGEVVRQSERFDRHHAALADLVTAGLTYRCYCTRREVREAARAPHGADVAYPGTCRELTAARRRELERDGRRGAVRLRAGDVTEPVTVDDRVAGRFVGRVDDVVLQRNDGVPAYHLAVVVDDDAQGITEVLRADDLLTSTPTQIHLQRLLGLPTPQYAHVPLVLAPDGQRLAKRHGAVTMAQLIAGGATPGGVLARLARSCGLCDDPDERPSPADLLERFDVERLDRTPWRVPAAELAEPSATMSP